MNLISSRLATRSRTRQVEASLKADAAAVAVDRAIGGIWGQILTLLRAKPDVHGAYHGAHRIFRQLIPTAATSIDGSLRRVAMWGHKTTAQALTGTLSADYLRAAAVRSVIESRQPATRCRSIREDKEKKGKFLPKQPGIVQLALDALGMRKVDLGALLREPVRDEFSKEQQKDIFAALLFPTPDEDTVSEMVYRTVQGVTWFQRLEFATRTSATPEQLATIVGQGFARGAMPQEIARDLLPVVDGVRSTATRIARTEGLRLAHDSQQIVFDGLGDLVIGYQIHATLDQNTRPAHAARNGTVYYASPTGNQLGYDSMPRPPLEADGSISWN